MGKSTSGPDWTDISYAIWEMERTYGITITVLAQAGTGYGGLPASGSVVGVPKKLDCPWEPLGWTVEFTWPNKDQATFEGAVFWALLKFEELAAKQRELDLT